jgi:carbonic anhydrase/acetyltransferase-like protein (isoleucine patch superfamily)
MPGESFENSFSFNGITPQTAGSAFLAPTAVVLGDVVIGRDASVWYGCVLRGDTERIAIGAGTNIQDLTVCHTDTGFPLVVGKGVTVGHRCVLHGCTIEDDCLIGMGAIVMNGAVIGHGSIVAAGATILEKTVVPPLSLVAGVPGAIKRTLPEASTLEAARTSAQHYLGLAAAHRRNRRARLL